MRPQTGLHASRTAWSFHLVALVPLLLLFALAPAQFSAQQPWPQNPQYAPQNTQPSPYANQYVPNQQPAYAQPQPHSQQPYPSPDQPIDQGPNSIYADDTPQPGYTQPQPPAQPLSPDQLEQLLAPIALYPDTLVAQILAAATYPAQVVGADHWLQAQGYASPDQIAYGADAQPWDPSVKALTAFPQVLAQMDRDLQWTTDLGNAYYNQPQDVLQTIQVLRQRAQNAGTLQNTPQEAVSYNQGYIQLAPTNPEVVYVPAYNPWDVYGQPIQPYSGFSLLGSLESLAGSAPVRFGLGIAMSAFSHTPFGWAGWALNWLTQSVLFHQSNYVSNSTTVSHWNNGYGGYSRRAGNFRQPGNFVRPATPTPYHPQPQMSFRDNEQGYNHPGYNGYNDYNRAPSQSFDRQPSRAPENYTGNRPYQAYRGYQQPGNYVRPAIPTPYRPQPQAPITAREQAYSRPGGSGFYGNAPRTYPNPQQTWRAPSSTYQRNDYAQRGYLSNRSYPEEHAYAAPNNRGFDQAYAKPEHSGGLHMFGGGHSQESSHFSYHVPKEYKAPKFHGGGGGGGSSHHSSRGGGFFGHHH